MGSPTDIKNHLIPGQQDVPASQMTWNINYINFEGRKVDLIDNKNVRYRNAYISKIALIAVAVLFAVIGTICMWKSRPYWSIASYAIAGIGFLTRNEDINKIKRANLLKEKTIRELGGQEAVNALPEVQWTHFDKIAPVLRKSEYFFPLITPTNLTGSVMRIMEDGELIGIAKKHSSAVLVLDITAFKPLPKHLHLLPKKEEMPGWDMVHLRDGSIEGRESKKAIIYS